LFLCFYVSVFIYHFLNDLEISNNIKMTFVDKPPGDILPLFTILFLKEFECFLYKEKVKL